MRVLLDANVLLSGSIATAGPIARIMSSWSNRTFDVAVSSHLRNEVARNIENPFFASRLDVAERLRYLRWINAMGIAVHLPPVHPRIASHPEDDVILVTAVTGAVDYLVTGDRQLLALGSHQGIPIISPTDFVTLLDLQP